MVAGRNYRAAGFKLRHHPSIRGVSFSGSTPNTRYMDLVLDQLRAGGNVLRDEDIERLSPLVHEHINLHGRYYFGVTEAVRADIAGVYLRGGRDLP